MTAHVAPDISLDPELRALIEERLAAGPYRSAREVIRAGLQALDEGRGVGAHKREKEARDESEALKAAILESALDCIITITDQSRVIEWNPAAERTFGYARDEALGRNLAELIIPEEYRDKHHRGMQSYMATGAGPLVGKRIELEALRADGSRFPVELAISPIAIGDKTRFTAYLRDITDQKRSERALRESEARFRHMADSAPALIWMTDAEGCVTFANMHYDYMFGRPAAEMLGDGWRTIILAEDIDGFEQAFKEAFDDRREFKAEVRVRDRHGAVRWLRCDGVPRLDDAGTFLGYTGCNVDITDVKLAQERQILLINELNHRVKNTLATVQSVAMQTLRNAATTEQAREDFEVRLIALSRAHDVLTRENWDGANLQEIVAQAVEPYRGAEDDRFAIGGPAVRLPPRMALALAMALQELATNAVKYGALSNAAGGVEIAWSVEEGEDEPRLRLRWREFGGPPVEAPRRRGFGSRLIERSLARDLDGEVALRFEPEGLVCMVDAPVQTS